MRRTDRESTDLATMESIIAAAKFCRMAMCDNAKPYVVPLCYGYKDRTVYIHSAREGYKLDILRKNSEVCIEFETVPQIIPNADPCKWKLHYKSVIARGTVEIVDTSDGKRRALGIIMNNYTSGSFDFSDEELAKTVVMKIALDSMTCKISS